MRYVVTREPPRPPGQLFFRLWRASHTRVAEELALIDLTPALFAVLNFLRAREGAIQQEIGSAMAIDPSTMVSLIDQLEDGGRWSAAEGDWARDAMQIHLGPPLWGQVW